MNRDATRRAVGLDREARGRDDGDRTPLWRRALSLVFTIAVVAGAVYLWPAMLGGSTRLVIVSGDSMEPTYDLRDIVVVRDSGNTQIGDVVVFEVPDGEAEGMLVIHRVLERNDEGFFITQGDNRTTPDQWQLTEEDIVGKPLAHIPQGGAALGFIQNSWVIALLVGLIALCVLWPDEDDERDELEERNGEVNVAASSRQSSDDTDALDREAIWAVVDSQPTDSPLADSPVVVPPLEPAATVARATPDDLAETWLDGMLGNRIDARIDDEVMAEAMVWLDEQLEAVEHLASH